MRVRRLVLLTCVLLTAAACSSTVSDGTPSSADLPRATQQTSTAASPIPSASSSQAQSPRTTGPKRTTSAPPAPRTTPRPTSTPRPAPAAAGLPLDLPTGDATKVITVAAPSRSSTTATLQGWQKSGGQWRRYGPATSAWLGSAGLAAPTREGLSATPMGSFTLTEAFGRNADPGTSLPYRRTTAADWWISEPGPLYNTLQHCTGSCAFTQGDPNEHLYAITPYYNYAVVIDYNRAPVVQGAGSAFFLHVAVGEPTAGCVAIPSDVLVTLMRWLTPGAHPRILIGVG